MTVSGPNICLACAHLREETADTGITSKATATCDAFPDGIPDAIYRAGFDHRAPFEGDNGVRFALEPEMDEFLEMYERSREG